MKVIKNHTKFCNLDLRIEARNKFAAEKKKKMKVDNTKVPPKTSSRANPEMNKKPKTKSKLDEDQKNTISEKSDEESYSNSNRKDVEMEIEDLPK